MKFLKPVSFLLPFCFLLLISCGKDEEGTVIPVIEKGSIIGKTSPPDRVERVRAVSVADSTLIYTTDPEDNGDFKIKNLPVGKYNVFVESLPGYKSYSMPDVPVYKDVENTLGEFEISRSATMTFTAANINYSGDNNKIKTLRNGNYLVINSGVITMQGVESELFIHLMNYTGPGTYNFSNANLAFGIFTQGDHQWKTISGQLEIRPFDVSDKLLRGTFSFEAVPDNDQTTTNISIGNGAFNNVLLTQ